MAPVSKAGGAAPPIGEESPGPDRRIRVMQLLPTLEIGGMETMVATLAARLDPDRFEVSVCCFDGLGPLGDELRERGISVLLETRRPGIDWRYPLRLGRRLREERIDVLHAHNATAFFYGTLAARRSRSAGSVFTEHDREHPDRVRVRLTHRLVSRWTTRTVAVSERLGRTLAEGEGFSPRRLETIHNGVDPQAFAGQVDREEAERLLGLEPGRPTIGVVAGLKPVKNHPVLLRAFKNVRGKIADCRLLFVGDGPQAQELRELTHELGISSDVHFLGFRRDIGAILPACDLVTLASRSEGFPLAILEAMAAGLPVVATDVGAVSEAVIAGQTGLLVPPGDVEALAEALASVLGAPDRAREMGRLGRERFEERFTIDRMVRGYESVYEAVVRETAAS